MQPNLSKEFSEFQHHVAIKFQLYNSLFLSLPFDRIEKTGILLQLFLNVCEEGFARRLSPPAIVNKFFADHTSIASERERIDLLFRFVQYAERQVVLFDALEDAAFARVNRLQGAGTLAQLASAVAQNNKEADLTDRLENFAVRLVLTAHPTQFYPGSVLGIINDLSRAIAADDLAEINILLQQLGRTPFINRRKPTPFDEAVSLIWYLENVFYSAAGNIAAELGDSVGKNRQFLQMGFWSGGDRDGNPFVTAETTLAVAAALSKAILRCYLRDVRALKRRLTFSGVEEILSELEQKLVDDIFAGEKNAAKNAAQNDDKLVVKIDLSEVEILHALREIRRILRDEHNDLFANLVEDLIGKVELFGTRFASLDVRQEQSEHAHVLQHIAEKSGALPANYQDLSEAEKIILLGGVKQTVDAAALTDEIARDTIGTVRAIKTIQRRNGETACERYIISQTNGALGVFEVYGLFLLAGWTAEDLTVDIVPLFETVADLKSAAAAMRELYQSTVYRQHLVRRGNRQTVMLGFSDGTKDGGYLAANHAIYRAKKELTRISEEFGVTIVFFDGRGGPPARGGGKTQRFYASMGAEVANRAIEITIQGQTVSSNFGTVAAAQYNLEQLVHAGVYNYLFAPRAATFADDEIDLMEQLGGESLRAYEELKNDPVFLDYLSHASPLKYYAATNIGSRPAKRGAAGKLALKDLRAIPFVGAWSQLKQNVPGFYGVGAALQKLDRDNKLDAVKRMYAHNAFFKTLLDNCEMAMQKSFFPLTEYLSAHPLYGEFWRKIRSEYELTKKYLCEVSGKTELMADYPIERQSIEMRERIMLPLLTIQQFALHALRELEEKDVAAETAADSRKALEKIVIRCSFGIINAGRNAV